MIYTGFDTSNYTSSVAVCGDIALNIRKILSVKPGMRGLRQSEALFQHTKNIPFLFEELCSKCRISDTKAVGVSTRPRNVDGSYMPVFLSGEGYARTVANTLGVPLYTFSHQDGHIMAGIHSSGSFELLEHPFISVHLSGGTCEILLSEYNGKEFSSDIIGGTKDISAGQLIDRVGVSLQLQFPCGKELELLAKNASKAISLPVNATDAYINFSGIETKSLSLVNTVDKCELALGVFTGIAKALTSALNFCIKKYHCKHILLVGGVASNSIIKDYLSKNIDAAMHFSSVEYSTDNAFGIALLAKYRT